MRTSHLIIALICLAGCRQSGGQTGSIPEYDSVTPCLNGTSIVSIGGRFGIIDSCGAEIVPAGFEDVFYITDDLSAAISGGSCEFYDRSGRRLGQIRTGDTGTSPECLLEAYADIREVGRRDWDEILDAYEGLLSYCSGSGADPEEATRLSGSIKAALGNISGPMDKDQQARFEAMRRGGR